MAVGSRPLGQMFQADRARQSQMKQFSCQKRRGGRRSQEGRERPWTLKIWRLDGPPRQNRLYTESVHPHGFDGQFGKRTTA